MLDATYYKDYRHNYLILKDNGCFGENVYQRKMVTENKIRGLLKSQERHINGELLLYYEITSRQSLFGIYDGKSIGREQLQKLFIQLKGVSDRLQKYLLDANGLILRPEFIYQDIESGEYFFLYYPGEEEGTFTVLLDFLLARVDNEDMEAVGLVYKMADLLEREQFALDEILKWFQDDVVDCGERKEEENVCQAVERKENFEWKENPFTKNESDEDGFQEESDSKEQEDDKKKIISRLLYIWGIWILGGGLFLFVRYYFNLSYQENIYFIAGGSVMTVLALAFSLWTISVNRTKFCEKGKKTEEAKEPYCYAEDFAYTASETSADSGNTIFVPWTENCENKLYSLDRKNKTHIDLERLPITVGKLAGAVDMVIKEQSISRMHAKFSKTGNNVYMTDLNSTNGTFKNGMRLSPNASEIIEPGDEIRLGKLKFIYR